MKLVIFGSKGQLGTDLIKSCNERQCSYVALDLPECDITDLGDLRRACAHMNGDCVAVNAAAFTAVDKAESEPDKAYAVNRDGAGNVARVCREHDVPLIHVSTDYVFDGSILRPYLATDAVQPMNIYGHSKAAGELAVRGETPRHVIVRTSWLFGLHGPNFVKTMLTIGKEREELRIVDDQVGCPTYAGDLARALLVVADRLHAGQAAWGTYHYSNKGAMTWYAFARRIFALARPFDAMVVQRIVPILAVHYPMPAARPQYTVLDCGSFDETFAAQRRPYDDALREMLYGFYYFP